MVKGELVFLGSLWRAQLLTLQKGSPLAFTCDGSQRVFNLCTSGAVHNLPLHR